MKKLNVINCKRAFLILLSMTLMIAFYSCKKASEKTSEKIIEKSIGDDAEVDIDDEKITIKTDEGVLTSDTSVKTWPKDIPGLVPEFDYGSLVSVSTQQMDDVKHWVVIFEEVPGSALDEYQTTLKKEGFKINFVTTAGTGGHLAAEKDDLVISIMSGEGNAAVTIGRKK